MDHHSESKIRYKGHWNVLNGHPIVTVAQPRATGSCRRCPLLSLPGLADSLKRELRSFTSALIAPVVLPGV